MEYRRLGRTGINVSVLSFGSWVTFDTQVAVDAAVECMQAAHDAGCNFFDNAEAYAGGRSETIMGEALRQLDWPRWSYVVTTKLFWGIHDAVNMKNTLNRKYLLQAIDGSLERFGLDFVDVVYCHRADPETPIEETVWAMSDIVASGKALYWGTSEWSATEIREAIEVAERHHLHKPVTEQPQYNLLERQRVEVEYAELFDEFGVRRHDVEPAGVRPAHRQVPRRHPRRLPRRPPRLRLAGQGDHRPGRRGEGREAAPDRRRARLHARPAGHRLVHQEPQRVDRDHRRQQGEQVVENFAALDVIPALTPDVLERIDAAVQ